jgi:predicted kinase
MYFVYSKNMRTTSKLKGMARKIILRKKSLILVAGYPGSGKTYLSHKLIQKIQAVYIDKDEIDDVFSTSRISPTYKKFKPYIHKIMYALASINLQLGNSVVIDSPFGRKYMGNKKWLMFIKGFARKHKATIKVLWCEAPNNIRKMRILKRSHARDIERKHEIEEFVSSVERFNIPFEHLYIETEKMNLQKILTFLKKIN